MRKWTQGGLALAALAILSVLPACLQNAPMPPLFKTPVNALALSAQSSLPFGNTASNIQKIQQKPYQGVVRFVLLGDNRNSSPVTTGGNKIYRKVIAKINELNPDFAINLGDFTFDSLRPNWKTFEGITSDVKVPYLTVVGNHDTLFGRSYYESNYTQPNPETGLDDYVFDYGNARFIILDSANYTYTERQFAWMNQQMQTPKKKFVFTHTPPRHGVWNHKLSPGAEVSARFMQLMEQNKVDLVLMGHIHLYDERQINGINYMVSGGAGAPMDKGRDFGQNLHHVVLIEVRGDQVSHQMIPIQTRIQTSGPTSFSTGLTPAQMNSPGVLQNYPPDFIPPEEE